MQKLSRRSILTPNRRPTPDLHRRPIYIDENGNLYDQDGNLRNATGQKLEDPDGHARAIDGRILHVSREDIADILQLANGPNNLFMQQRSIPDKIPAVPDKHPRADTTEIGSHQSCQPIDVTNVDVALMTSMEPECSDGNRRTNMVSTEMSLDMQGAHICLPKHATSFAPTNQAPEIYTKDEINEMVTGICGAQEKLGDELKTLVDDTYQPLDRGYNELFRSMAEMRTEIESMQHILEKEATTSPSIDANKATSIDVKPQTSQIPTEPESLAEKKDEWEIAYINTKINEVYNPLNNNVDWLSTRIDLLQQDLDTIRKKDQQPATSIDICTITSIDSKFAAMEDRLQTYEDMHDRFTSPIMRYLDTLSTQMMNVQRDIGTLNDQHDFQEECSTSIDRFRRASLDVKKPTEHLPYTAAECVDFGIFVTASSLRLLFHDLCDLDDSFSSSTICYGLLLPKAHAFDHGPLRYYPKLGPTFVPQPLLI
ncbi:hypothetical protein F2Q68_00014744 [Brassica cretica]|uniref:Uncharacterized protein n=1 Tax=Brassica cretica TaxID=69181 RepID=A0A8S9HIL9_BRACR|nr:hypothetical protein F2Q68_00014744 [Brassica cretica]